MENAVFVRAPAKVNLHLRVYGRRSDGFHGILSLFQAVSLADELSVGSLKQPNALEIDGTFDCPPEATTIHKAVLAYRGATGDSRGLAIRVKKVIPAGAGLGGGSSDAAATLRALEALRTADGLPGLGPEALKRLGATIGSDVPFFLDGGAALVRGRGEFVEPVPARGDFALLLVFPGFGVGTPWAYGLLDRERPDDSAESDPSAESLLAAYRGKPETWPFANSFEPCVSAARPEIASLVAELRRLGASFAMMSGSGSTVFGVFADLAAAEGAGKTLASAGSPALRIFPTLPLARPTSLE